MTNKQLLKKLQYQQNRLLNVKGYSFYLSYSNGIDINRSFTIYIHDGNKNQDIIYKNHFSIEDTSLNNKLSELKDFIDDLLNKESIRN